MDGAFKPFPSFVPFEAGIEMIAKVAESKIQSNGDENDGRAFAAWVIGKATAFEKYPIGSEYR
ncbi:hypothetical protein [Paenibacillus sp. USDA918EY]|uniref:Uncharacterized protein n=1 Tax=Paenibacillus albilobatus TaxID=2716884 RepID=A0A919XI85_9BACL|nr:hypothetical protein [Paenibacillus sp. USDA918EY]GIO30813.1 hypothetical protein J2TS6_19540 [Paenibacillus albilobatus]